MALVATYMTGISCMLRLKPLLLGRAAAFHHYPCTSSLLLLRRRLLLLLLDGLSSSAPAAAAAAAGVCTASQRRLQLLQAAMLAGVLSQRSFVSAALGAHNGHAIVPPAEASNGARPAQRAAEGSLRSTGHSRHCWFKGLFIRQQRQQTVHWVT